MGRISIYYTKNAEIKKLFKLFKINQGNLYHYKDKNIAASIIANKQFQITRADCFSDKSEIKYGIKLLKKISSEILNESEKEMFKGILRALNKRLKQTYIFCMTKNDLSDFMLKNYGNTILKLNENFAEELFYTTWHAMPMKDGFKLLYPQHIFVFYEGFVQYDNQMQISNAIKICEIFKSLNKKKLNNIDSIHFVDALLKYITLTKRLKFSAEQEYRCLLIAKGIESNQIKSIEKNDNGKRFYLEVTFPNDYQIIKK